MFLSEFGRLFHSVAAAVSNRLSPYVRVRASLGGFNNDLPF